MKTQVYIDLSRLCLTPFTSGIQRVAKEIVLRLLQNDSLSITLLSVLPSNQAWRVLPQDAFTAFYTEKQGSPYGTGKPIILTPNDIPSGAVFFDIDSAWNMPMHRGWLFPILKAHGVTIVTQLYDLIPITEPQFFHEQTLRQFISWTTAILQFADQIICNAEATKAALHTLCRQLNYTAPPCAVVPLGADFAKKSAELEKTDTELLEKLPKYGYILMVGTIEPRKNHQLLLDAVPALSKRGIKVVFAGRIGWNMEQFAKAMDKHPKKGTDFFFAQGPSDATIQALYKNALAVAFPTKNEGFGLPIVEAYLNGTPVLASDIPVLREVGGDMAGYFDNTSVDSLVEAVDNLRSDMKAYEKKRTEIAAYRPRTWDDTANDMANVLAASGNPIGTMPEDCRISQMVVLTARNEDLLRSLPYYDYCMPFIQRLLVCCPERNVRELQEKWQGRIQLDFFTDEQLLEGDSLPEDHVRRNFFLRSKLMKKAPLDDVFIMTDDDYRPLMPITQEFFLKDRRCQAYYFYDLTEWKGTQSAYTSFDLGMFRMRDFLVKHRLPTLQYSSHQPQVIVRKYFLEMMEEFPDLISIGPDEWNIYFNWCIAKHTTDFSTQRYCCIGWPGAISDWQLWCQPRSLIFENFYESLYEKGHIFEGLSTTFCADTFTMESAEKIARWSRELEKQTAYSASWNTYREMYRDVHGKSPEFLLTRQENGVLLDIPELLYVPAGAVMHLPVLADADLRNADTPILYEVTDDRQHCVIQEKTLLLPNVDAGVTPELILAMPPYAFRGILTIHYGELTCNCAISCLE
ncbi:MAG: glycosyltransferase family 4 protein [Oscillospiraceae bacterium]|nr:glycosyltransferase family 4 protein [Oscillospiraceae bacterium]